MAEAIEDFVDAGGADEVGLAEKLGAEPVEMDVRVDEAGGEGFVFKVDSLCLWNCQFFEFSITAEGEDFTVGDRHGGCARTGIVEGDEVAVGEEEVGVLHGQHDFIARGGHVIACCALPPYK